jgi:hypothetical protein
MTAITIGPRMLPPSILDALSSADLEARFAVCAMLTTELWSCGHLMCRTPAEQEQWGVRLLEYLELARTVWSHSEAPGSGDDLGPHCGGATLCGRGTV